MNWASRRARAHARTHARLHLRLRAAHDRRTGAGPAPDPTANPERRGPSSDADGRLSAWSAAGRRRGVLSDELVTVPAPLACCYLEGRWSALRCFLRCCAVIRLRALAPQRSNESLAPDFGRAAFWPPRPTEHRWPGLAVPRLAARTRVRPRSEARPVHCSPPAHTHPVPLSLSPSAQAAYPLCVLMQIRPVGPQSRPGRP